jgi:hypothetical protein
MAKSVACSNPKCGKRFADVIGDGKEMPVVIDLVRRGQQIMVTGPTYTVSATCRFCKQRTSLIVTDGKLDESDLKFRDAKEEDEEVENPGTPNENPPSKEEEDKPSTPGSVPLTDEDTLPTPDEELEPPVVEPEVKPKFTKAPQVA